MEFQLDNSHDVYIQMITSAVVDKAGLIAAMSELVRHPDYHKKHSLWDFRQATLGLSIGDLGEIVGVLRLYKTREKNFANKSALVVPGVMDMSMARVFISLSKLLPFDYKVFKDIEEARTFLTTDSG